MNNWNTEFKYTNDMYVTYFSTLQNTSDNT